MRIVLDTSVLVAAFRSPFGASRIVLSLIAEHRILLAASSALYREYEAVLTRPEQIAVHGVPRERLEEFLIRLAGFTKQVRINYRYRPQLQDANDELVLEAAINAGVRFIVTYNVRDFLPAASRFGIEILTPASILNEERFKL